MKEVKKVQVFSRFVAQHTSRGYLLCTVGWLYGYLAQWETVALNLANTAISIPTAYLFLGLQYGVHSTLASETCRH